MRLSSQKDLLLVIILSLVVLLLNWLQLFKGYPLTFINTIAVLFLPGYTIITAIWPTDERMGWGMRTGMGFVLGLFFVLFLPLILNYLNLGSLVGQMNNILFIIAVLLSLLTMFRRSDMYWEEEPGEREIQLTLEESIERAARMRENAVEHDDKYLKEDESPEKYPPEDVEEIYPEHGEEIPSEYEEESYPEDEDEYIYPEHDEEHYHEQGDEEIEQVDEPISPLNDDDKTKIHVDEKESDDLEYESWRKQIKEQKPLQYERIKEKYDEEPTEHYPLRVDESVKTDSTPSDYEKEMNTPVWRDDPPEKKPGFKYWDLIAILFLSGISLLFLYFNPLKTTTTSMIFFILLLFIQGYAAITIIFPDKSRASSRDLILASSIIAIILFIISFLACMMQILPSVPKYLVQVMIIASVVLVAGAFLRKWKVSSDDFKEDDLEEEDLEEEDLQTEEDIPAEETEVVTPEKLHEPVKEAEKLHEEPVKELEEKEKKDPFAALKRISQPVKTEDTETDEDDGVTGEDVHKKPPVDWVKPCYPSMDLLLVVTITILTAAFVLIPPLNQTFIRTILGILLVLFIPGYTLIAALFPRRNDLDGIERAALSFGLSIAVTPLIGLALNYTPWGIRLDPILISLTIFTLAMCTIAFLRRKKLPEEERFNVPFNEFIKGIKGSFKGESKMERILSIILIISIILAIATTVYIIVKPKEGEKFTEFYILGPNGTASNYPTNLTSGQNGTVIIGVVNHEYATTNYLLAVKVNNSTLMSQNITLSNGEKVEIPYTFTAGNGGQKKMEFLLYKLPDNETAYRSLHLWLNVK